MEFVKKKKSVPKHFRRTELNTKFVSRKNEVQTYNFNHNEYQNHFI